MWNFEWSINTNTNRNGGALSTLNFLISIDLDASSGEILRSYDPLDPVTGQAYLENSNTPMNPRNPPLTASTPPSSADLLSNIIAQNSVNYGFFQSVIPTIPLGDGEFTVRLEALNANGGPALEQSINVIVGPGVGVSVVPAPGALALMLGGLGLLCFTRRAQR